MSARGMLLVPIFVVALGVAILCDHSVTLAVQNGPDYLHRLGASLSWTGNTGWMAICLIIWAIFAAVLSKYAANSLTRKNAQLLLNLAIVLFLTILISGTCVQLLKHAIGRARPEHFKEFGAFSFRSFAIGQNFNSFPSGHATTVGALAMIGISFAPQHRWCLLAFAALAGAARVAVGAHYPSDVVAGFALGAVTSALLLRALVARQVIPSVNSAKWDCAGRMVAAWLRSFAQRPSLIETQTEVMHLRRTILLLLIMFAVLILFISYPEVDLAVSAVFYDPNLGFWLSDVPELALARRIFGVLVFSALFGSLVLWGHAKRTSGQVDIPGSVWAFVVTALVVGPGLIANALFKSYWGRARPAHVEQFGGEAEFTLPFELAGECAKNCSFVSGEGSGIAMLVLIGFALGWPRLRRTPWLTLVPITAFGTFGIALRVVKGRHFLSDTLFAVLLMALVLTVLYRTFQVDRHRAAITWHALTNDLKRCLGYAIAPASFALSLRRDLGRLGMAVAHIPNVLAKVLWVTTIGARK